MSTANRWALATFLGASIAVAARRRQALSTSGAAGAALVGTAIFGSGGLPRAVPLLLFFGSSTALSRLSGKKDKVRTGPRRTLGQVLANGGLPALLALAYARTSSPHLLAAYSGALAAVNADTWATEIGALSTTVPRMITTGQPAPGGVSGAVTPLGTLASLGGAALIAAVSSVLSPRRPSVFWRLTLAGFGGSLVDSLLGATLQAVYRCAICGARTENRRHTHGHAPRLTRMRGLPVMTNDTVNACAALTGAAIAALLHPD